MSVRPLREYQTDCLTSIETARAEGLWRVLVQAATGVGKTQIFASIPTRLRSWLSTFPANDRRVLVIAHREELIDQAVHRFQQLNPGMMVSAEQGDRVASQYADVIVASIQTLTALRCRRLLRLLKHGTFRLVIYDECHHASSPTARTALVKLGFLPPSTGSDVESLDEAPSYDDIHVMEDSLAAWDANASKDRLLVGFTATPNRSDGVGLGAVFQDICFSYPIRKAVTDGWLVPPVPFVIETDTSLEDVKTTAGDFNQKQLAAAVNQEARNQLAVKGWQQYGEQRSTLCFTVDVAHAHALAEMFVTVGVRAVALSGLTPKEDRRVMLRQYTEGQVDLIANCFDRETEILSRDKGWIGPSSVAVGDIVAGVVPQTGEFRWIPVTQIVARDSSERFVSIRNQTLNLRMTEGHRVLWRTRGVESWRITEAKELPTKGGPYEFRVSTWGSHLGVGLPYWDLEFLGLFATDGSLNRKRASIEIAQSARSPMCAEIERILTACRFDWRWSNRIGRTPAGELRPYRIYRIPKGNIGGALKRRGWGRLEGWLDKSLSPRLAECRIDEFDALVNGLWIGDGLKTHRRLRPKSGIEICTADPALADSVQAWAVVRGWACSLSWHDNGPLATKPIGYLRLRKRQTVCTNNRSVKTSGGNPSRFEPLSVEPVWCVSNELGTVIARRHGRVMVTGQCMVLTEGTDLPRTGCILHAKPTKSATLYEQMTGRGLRLFGGKDKCIVIDVVDVAKRHSLQVAPSLYGLPPGLIGKGETLDVMADNWDDLLEKHPGLTDLLTTRLSIDQLRVKASTFDIWSIPDLGAFGQHVSMNWIKTAEDVYHLQYPWQDGKETIQISRDLLGKWEIVCTIQPPDHAPKRQRTIAHGILDAAAASAMAESFLEQERRNVMKLKDKAAPWRTGGASDKQLATLRKFKVPHNPTTITKGQASDLLDLAFSRMKARGGR